MRDWMDYVMYGIFVMLLMLLVAGVVCIHDSVVTQQQIKQSWSAQYDVEDVEVVLEAIDADWHDFNNSITLRHTYERVRDGKESLGEIKKKKNTTTCVPMVVPIR